MNFLLLTAHDYRTPRRANMHFIADELAKRGTMRFFSLRYSALSKWKNDARTFLDGVANRVEQRDGVDCFLWKTVVHPFNTRRRWARPIENALFRWSQAHPPATLVRWMKEADVILFESGSAVLHVALAARINPQAKRVYIASDDLGVIDVAEFVQREFVRVAPSMDALCLPSVLLAHGMPSTPNRFLVPHGIDRHIVGRGEPNPYRSARNAVSVGSMLFDRTFFEMAGEARPDIDFHVIGPGAVERTGFPANVHLHDEMPHEETLRYIKHADFGIAPYVSANVPAYLTDTSMKLMQYALFGMPAVCPSVVAGDDPRRFGYMPGSLDTIVAAIERALACGPVTPPRYLGWDEVTDRLLDPRAYDDTRPAALEEPA